MSKKSIGTGITRLLFGLKGKDLKVIPYNEMSPQQFEELDRFLGKVGFILASDDFKLTKRQSEYLLNQIRQLDLYRERMMPSKNPDFKDFIPRENLGIPAADKAREFKGFDPKVIQGGKDNLPRIPKNAKKDMLDSYKNLFLKGEDTKYDADVLATDLAERRGFIKEGQDATDMDQRKYSDLYGEAYNFLTQSRFLNKPPRKPKAKGGLATALAKLKKKFGKDIIQKGKAPKRNKKKKLQDLFREFNRKNKAGGGVAHMLGEPREEMAAGGIPLRRLLQFLHQGMDKPQKASEGLKKMKLPKQMKFFAEKQGFNPDQIKIDYLENVLDGLKKDRDLIKSVEPSPTKNELENMASGAFRESFVDTTQGGRFKGLDSEMIESSIMELETIIKNLKTKGQGRKLNAEGGRIGFADGGMSRRTFLKIMAA